jgi:hypothetical protein
VFERLETVGGRVLKKYLGKSALLTLLAIGLVSLFAVGCGSSDNFVATGTNNNNANPAQSGNLIFNFVQAQDTVPVGTTTLRFDFFSSDPPSLASFLFTETRSFASQIIIQDVPPEVEVVVVTAFGDNNEPLAVLTGNAVVVLGGDSTVDLVFNSNPTFNSLTLTPAPAIILSPQSSTTAQVAVSTNFDTAQVLGQQTSYDVNIAPADCSFNFQEGGLFKNETANITTDGLVTAVNYRQNATLSCEYTAFGTTRSDTTLVRTCLFAVKLVRIKPLDPTDSRSITYKAGFSDSDGSPLDVSPEVTFSLKTAATGVSVDSVTGTITTNGAAAGTYTVVATWVDPRTQNADGTGGTGATFTDEFNFDVVDGK